MDRELARARLVAQGLVTRPYATPLEAVASFGAMQGQDLPGAMASVALRAQGGAVAEVIEAMDAGQLVRGYPMRGTVFLVAAADLLWVSQLCNAQALKAARRRRAQLGLTDAMVDAALGEAQGSLGERGLSRTALFARWEAIGTPTDKGRGYHVLAHLIGEGELCYGPWNGTDQDVVLASRWLPANSTLEARFNGDRVAAVTELLRRYITSHGPATLRDFAWWTKLPLKEIRAAWASLEADFEVGEGTDPQVWRVGLRDEVAALGRATATPLLLPGFDEFILGYQDRLFAMSADEHALLVPGNNGVFGKSVVVDGQVRGIWKRGGAKGRRALQLACFEKPLTATQLKKLDALFAAFPFPGE